MTPPTGPAPLRALFLVPHPPAGASTRYRVLQFLPALEALGIAPTVWSMLAEPEFARLYRRGRVAAKALDWTRAAVRRYAQVRRAGAFDVVFIHREVWPLRGLLHERALWAANPRWVFDLDDAVFLPNVSPANRAFGALKDAAKSDWIAARARAVTAGNAYLKAWAETRRAADAEVLLTPTAVDTDRWSPAPAGAFAPQNAGRFVLGWIGSHTTVPYLEPLRPVFDRLRREVPGLTLRVVGAMFRHSGLDVECVPWSLDTEVNALRGVDVGLAPLPDTEWSRGKCGLKLLQYMAVGRPVVASPVGANCEIVRANETGWFARSEDEWVERLVALGRDRALGLRAGQAGRARVVAEYSLPVVAPRIANALRHAAGER